MKIIIRTLPFFFALALSSVAQDPKVSSTPLTAGRDVLVSVTADVQSIDLEKREVTLKGPLGNEVTFVVDKRVQRLNEFKPGDHVTADYYVSVGKSRPATVVTALI